jgi:uncharacterized protein with von Willebrand factor type A (vWA) domain
VSDRPFGTAPAEQSSDLALFCVHFAQLLRSAGVPVPVERVAWWARATLDASPALIGELYWLARVTLIDRQEQIEVFDAVFGQVFRGLTDVADFRGEASNQPSPHTEPGPPSGMTDPEAEEPPAAEQPGAEHEHDRAGQTEPADHDGLRHVVRTKAGFLQQFAPQRCHGVLTRIEVATGQIPTALAHVHQQ